MVLTYLRKAKVRKNYSINAFVNSEGSDYRFHPEYWDRQAGANSEDPDQTPKNSASD